MYNLYNQSGVVVKSSTVEPEHFGLPVYINGEECYWWRSGCTDGEYVVSDASGWIYLVTSDRGVADQSAAEMSQHYPDEGVYWAEWSAL